MKRFQLSYDDLKEVNPSLIMTSFSGYGQSGPYSDYRANGTTIEATAGWDSLFGYRNGPPLVMGFYQTDAITGLQMAATTLAALNHRNRTGEGQYIQGSMFEAAVSYIDELVLQASLGQDHERFGNRHPDIAPQGVYRFMG
jgi:succinate--hydroxymethylglutarate CoA-transferase